MKKVFLISSMITLMLIISACKTTFTENSSTNKTSDTNIINITSTGSSTSASTTSPKPSKEYLVSNKDELSQAVTKAGPNTIIILEDGIYKDINLKINNNGTDGNPIYIKAKNQGKVFITGKSQIHIKGNYVIIDGIEFRDGEPFSDRGCIFVEGDYVRLTNIRIINYKGSNKKWVSLSGKFTELDHSHFEGKRTAGALLTIWRDDNSPNYHYIHHNYFKDYQQGIDVGDNGFETIRIGTSDNSQSDSFTIVENNLFENLNSEIEIISIKSGRNVIRNNTIIKSLGLITSRHGKNNLIENNVIIQDGLSGSGGIRVYDRGHVIRNNYIQGIRSTSNSRGAIIVHSGNNKVGEKNQKLNLQWTANNILIENNTIYDSQQSFVYDDKYQYQPSNITFRNNVVFTKSYSVIREIAGKELKNGIYENELYYGTSLGLQNTVIPSGINFSNKPFEMNFTNDELWLHSKFGVQNIKKLTKNDVGPCESSFIESTSLNEVFFKRNFINWPFDNLPKEVASSITN